jgi:hypothetical protein
MREKRNVRMGTRRRKATAAMMMVTEEGEMREKYRLGW